MWLTRSSLSRNLLKFFGLALVPGYRVLSLILCSLFASEEFGAKFAEMFFWLGAITAFSGSAVAYQVFVPTRDNSWVFLFSIAVVLIAIFASLASFTGILNQIDILLLLLCSAAFSFYEIIKNAVIVEGNYYKLFFSGVGAVVLLPLIFYYLKSDFFFLIGAVFLIPTLLLSPLPKRTRFSIKEATPEVLGDIASYSLSNLCSTGVGFLMPILLMKGLDSAGAIQLAYATSVASMYFLYPRFLSAGLIKRLQERVSLNNVLSVRSKIQVTLLAVYLLSVGFYFFGLVDLTVGLFFCGLCTTQLSVPAANALTVLGYGRKLLYINVRFVLLLSVFLFLVLSNFGVGAEGVSLCSLGFLVCAHARVLDTFYVARVKILDADQNTDIEG